MYQAEDMFLLVRNYDPSHDLSKLCKVLVHVQLGANKAELYI